MNIVRLKETEVLNSQAVAIGTLYQKAKTSFIDSTRALIECGDMLLAQKKEIGHGKFIAWLKTNEKYLGFGERTARMLMSAAKRKLTSDLDESTALKISRDLWGNTPKLPKTVEYVSDEGDDGEEEEEAPQPGQLHTSARIRGLMFRAKEAKELAEADNMSGIAIDDEVRAAVSAAAEAWITLLQQLEGSK